MRPFSVILTLAVLLACLGPVPAEGRKTIYVDEEVPLEEREHDTPLSDEAKDSIETAINLHDGDASIAARLAAYGKDGHSGGWTGPGPAPYSPPAKKWVAFPKDRSTRALGRILEEGDTHDSDTEWLIPPKGHKEEEASFSPSSNSELELELEKQLKAGLSGFSASDSPSPSSSSPSSSSSSSASSSASNGARSSSSHSGPTISAAGARSLKGGPTVPGGGGYAIGHTDNATPADGALCVGDDTVLFMTNGRSTLIPKDTIDDESTYTHEFPDSWIPHDTYNFDPRCRWDHRSNRFIVIYADGAKTDDTQVNVAISKSATPTSFSSSDWEHGSYSMKVTRTGGENRWGDYPTLGISEDVVYIAWLHGDLDSTAVKTVDGSSFLYWKRSTLINGAGSGSLPSGTRLGDLSFSGTRPLISCLASDYATGSDAASHIFNIYGSGTSMAAIRMSGADNFNDVQVFRTFIQDDPEVLYGSGDDLQRFDQRGVSSYIDAGQRRVIHCGQRGDTAWYSLHGASNLDDNTRDLPANTFGVVTIDGIAGSARDNFYQRGLYRGYGYQAGVLDKDDNVGMVYAASSKMEYPSAYFSVVYADENMHEDLAASSDLDWGETRGGRARLAAAGQNVITNSDPENDPRWGDYYDLVLDPEDDATMWALVSSSEEGDNSHAFLHLVKFCPSCDLECDPPCASNAKCTKALVGHSCGACAPGYKNPPDCLEQICDPPCGIDSTCVATGVVEDPSDDDPQEGTCICRPGWVPDGSGGCDLGSPGPEILELGKKAELSHDTSNRDTLTVAVIEVTETGKALILDIERTSGQGLVVVRYEGMPDVGDWSGFEWGALNRTLEEETLSVDPAHPGVYYIALYAGGPGDDDATVEIKSDLDTSTEAKELLRKRIITGLIIFGSIAGVLLLIGLASRFNSAQATGGLDAGVYYGGDGRPPPPKPNQGPGFFARFAAKNAFAVTGEAPPEHLVKKKGGSGRKAPPGRGPSPRKQGGSGRKAPPRGPSPGRGIPGPAGGGGGGGGGGGAALPFIQAEEAPAGAVAGGVPGNYMTSPMGNPEYGAPPPAQDYYDEPAGGNGIVGGGDPDLGPARPIPNSPTAGAGRVMTLGTAMKVAGGGTADPELTGGGGGSKRKAAGGGKKGSKGSKGSRGNRSKKGSNRSKR